jgi:hypothetical protein
MAIALISAFLAVFYTFSTEYCTIHNMDTLIPTLAIRENVTLYYWGQNRYGNLIPFLTQWITDLHDNLIVQTLVRAVCAGVSPLFFILVTNRRAPLLLVYSLSLVAVVLLEQKYMTFFFWVGAVPFSCSLAVAVAAILLARQGVWRFNLASAGRGIVLFVVCMIAEWVNVSLALLVVPLFIGLFGLLRKPADAFLAAAFGLAAIAVAAHAATLPGPEYGRIIWSVGPLFRAIGTVSSQISWPIGIGLAAAALASIWAVRRDREFLWRLGTLLVATLISFDLTARNVWVIANHDHYHYFVPQILAFATITASLISAVLWRFAGLHVLRGVLLLASPVVALSTAAAKTLPVDFSCRMLSTPEQNAVTDAIANIALRADVRFMAGDYWVVGPAVYETLRRGDRDVFAVMERGEGAREPALAVVKRGSNKHGSLRGPRAGYVPGASKRRPRARAVCLRSGD